MPERRFRKTGPAGDLPRFEAELDGLDALRATGCVRVPEKVGAGMTADGTAWLELEYLELDTLDRSSGAKLGEQLATLHRQTGSLPDAAYGWPRDNFIGGSSQSNRPHTTWAGFFAAERLRPQLAWAAGNGMERTLREKGERLAEHLGAFFLDYRPQPCLLHGDLWSGNAGQLPDGTPAIFDPAVYRGDREADLAMSELFGGFPESFYAAYRQAWPLDPGYETRKTLYNLYHVLNHFNLFGGGYLGQAKRMIEKLAAELRG
ncbi:MAG: fructosamine kinase family protein [Rhodocyclaceae bacterium]|jgi:fructosamine-3-kinase|nr:fructosamine kinase family protein [Rhodocyclaceae bacterium]